MTTGKACRAFNAAGAIRQSSPFAWSVTTYSAPSGPCRSRARAGAAIREEMLLPGHALVVEREAHEPLVLEEAGNRSPLYRSAPEGAITGSQY